MTDLKFEKSSPERVEVDDDTLAAIDRGLEDVAAGRTVSLEEVRTRTQLWNFQKVEDSEIDHE